MLAVMCVGGAAGFAQTPVINPFNPPNSTEKGGVENGASFVNGQAVAPGSLISIFGSNLASSTAPASTIPLSTMLGATQVTFNNIPAPLLYIVHDAVNGDQINAQLPWEVTGSSSANVVVTSGGVPSAPVNVSLTPASPGVFSYCANPPSCSNSLAIAYGNSDQAFAWASGAVPGLATHAAKIGDPTTLVILATGLGPVTTAVPTGNIPAAGYSNTTSTPTVTVGGVPAQVVFSGLINFAVGVYQINIVIQPGTPTGSAVPLQITVNGVTSNMPAIAVSN
jgi:uncharacterized protein (TIGR03437 family)